MTSLFEDLEWIFREQTVEDFGIDAQVELVLDGCATGRLLGVQVKSGPSYFSDQRDGHIFHWTGKPTVKYWLDCTLPVILVLCDPSTARAYWVHVTEQVITEHKKGSSVRVPIAQKFDAEGHERLRAIAESRPASRSREMGDFNSVRWENEVVQILPYHTPDGVRHAIYPKPGKVPEAHLAFDADENEKIQEFIDTGRGGVFKGNLVRANFLPGKFENSRIEAVFEDRSSDRPLRLRLDWEGNDGYTFSSCFVVRATRFGVCEAYFENALIERDRFWATLDVGARSAQIGYSFKVEGANVKKGLKILKFKQSAARGGTLSLVESDSELVLSSAAYRETSVERDDPEMVGAIHFLDRCVFLQEKLGVPLFVPIDWFSEDDWMLIEELCGLVETGTQSLGNCSMKFSMVPNEAFSLAEFERKAKHHLTFEHDSCKLSLLGNTIDLGPTITVIPNAEVTVLSSPGGLVELAAQSGTDGVLRTFKRFL